MNKYLSILLVSLFASCDLGHYKRVQIESVSKHNGSVNSLLFPCSSIGIRGGDTVKDSIPFGQGDGYKSFNATSWRTIDGGRNWTHQKIADGVLQKLILKDGIVYAVIYTGGAQEKFQCQIYHSKDLGETWNLKCILDKRILRVHVLDSNQIIGDIEEGIGETKDGGKTWSTLPTRYFIYKSFYHYRFVYYLSSSKKNVRLDILGRKDIETGEEKILTFPDGFSGKDGKDNLVFCHKDEELRAYRINDNFTLTYLSSIKKGKIISVDYIGIYDEHIFIFVTFLATCIFWGKNSFYYSSNGGKSWKRLGCKGFHFGCRGRVTDYIDSTGFNIIFYRNQFSLGSFSVPTNKHDQNK